MKKDSHWTGVRNQYGSGTAGGIENCQIGVSLAYVSHNECPSCTGICICRTVAHAPTAGNHTDQGDALLSLETPVEREMRKSARTSMTEHSTCSQVDGRPSNAALMHRNLYEKPELAYYILFEPFAMPFEILARLAVRRSGIENGFQMAKPLVGRDRHEVRDCHRTIRQHLRLKN